MSCGTAQQKNDSSYPLRPIKILVPFEAGGGSDTFARTMARAIEEHKLLPQRLVIVNLPGAGGTIGSRRMLGAAADGYTILCLHEAILTAKYSGKVPYGPEAFLPIAGTGRSPLVICVAEQSRFRSLRDLMLETVSRPDSVIFSANIGAPSQFAGLLLETDTPGSKFRYTQNGGGTKRFAALDGGHADVSAFSLAEYTQFKNAGLRAIAVCSSERHPDVPSIPTSVEQGFDCVSENMHFWWAPQNTSQLKIDRLATAFRLALETPDVRTRLAQMRITPVFLNGTELRTEIQQREIRLRSVSPPSPVPLPNLPLIVGLIVLGCIVLSALQWHRNRQQQITLGAGPSTGNLRLLVVATGLLLLYVIFLQSTSIGFASCTIVFLVSLGLVLMVVEPQKESSIQTWRYRTKSLAFVVFSVAFSLVLEVVFTRILVIDLP